MLNFLPYPAKERKRMFKHLTQEQRYHIEAYKKAGYGNAEIAKDLGVHPSTIGRELKKFNSHTSKVRCQGDSRDIFIEKEC